MAADDDPAASASIARERTAILYRNAPIGIVASSLMGLVSAWALAADDPAVIGWSQGWSLLLVLCMAFHLGVCRAYGAASDPEPRLWNRLFVLAALFEGLAWGMGALIFASPTHYYRQVIMLVLSSGLVASTAFVLSTQLAPFRAFFYPAIVPHVLVQLVYPYPLHLLAEAATLAFILSVSIATQRTNAQVVDVLRLRFLNEVLAQDLRVQMERAEEANLAKSRFLAAASHDLRQPVHAMGMFVGVLQGRPLDPASRRIVEHLDGTVSALDDLFGALLDVSKLDAGVVQPALADVAVDPVLDRICREHAGEARAKALELRRVPSTLWITTDPVLLERVVRNLVSNAIRYTDQGRIVVGCRRDRNRVSILVADTGRGIPQEDAVRIFDEFYQVANPERDRSQGLGLGLAIVRRVAPLIGGEVTLRSSPGVGSVFSLQVPRAAPPGLTADHAAPTPAPAAGRGPVLVLDDEADILRGMSALLGGWGHDVITASTIGDMLDRIARSDSRPELLVADYRLANGESGIEAIRRAREALGADLPALLITGDTAPDRLAEAVASGIPLLHKPVAPSRLRAAMGNLLREASPQIR